MSELPNDMPLNDEERQAFWKYMYKTEEYWAERNLRTDEIDEDEEE
jgi:hypothetical protein